MSVAETDTINEIADRLSAAIEKSNVAAVDRLWSDDIAVWRVGARRDNDKARALGVIDWFITATAQRHYGFSIVGCSADPSADSSSGTSCTPRDMPAN